MKPKVFDGSTQGVFRKLQAWVGELGIGRRCLDCLVDQRSRHLQQPINLVDSGAQP